MPRQVSGARSVVVVALASAIMAAPTRGALLGGPQNLRVTSSQRHHSGVVRKRSYLGFDRDQYPGDAKLATLRKRFSYASYWLNNPQGETSNTWSGKRKRLAAQGFGFLVLFGGRSYAELKAAGDADGAGKSDAAAAVAAARREGFPRGTIIFLDVEEGGRMLAEQRAYLHAWVDGVNHTGYRAGVYCSAMPITEASGATVVTANDIRDHTEGRRIVFWVYNVACPPSPGCAFPQSPPPPSASGVSFAAVWQFAQSPRRKEAGPACQSNYAANGNCYAPGLAGDPSAFLDVDTATSPDPSHGRGL